jgi:hypothetical protein
MCLPSRQKYRTNQNKHLTSEHRKSNELAISTLNAIGVRKFSATGLIIRAMRMISVIHHLKNCPIQIAQVAVACSTCTLLGCSIVATQFHRHTSGVHQ